MKPWPKLNGLFEGTSGMLFGGEPSKPGYSCRTGAGREKESTTLNGRENDCISGLNCLSRLETTFGMRPTEASRLGRRSSGLPSGSGPIMLRLNMAVFGDGLSLLNSLCIFGGEGSRTDGCRFLIFKPAGTSTGTIGRSSSVGGECSMLLMILSSSSESSSTIA